ncbi:MAG TPA: thioredoxin domain-containing protein [Burkholderiaceae bacterium]|nr:thioredoxin domain-containing protein [Burkholderiaceae bacterium]
MNKRLLVIATAVLAIGAFAVGAYLYKQTRDAQTTRTAMSSADLLARPNAPMLGGESAKVVIVEFLDPACEACRALAPVVKSLVTASFGQAKLIVRYAPFHKGSDQAVRILEAARLQGKYWPVLDAMFESQSVWAAHDNPRPELIWNFLGATGLDIAKAKADMQDPRITEILNRDMADVRALKVTKTPSFFVNGKPLLDFGPEQLRQLVRSETRLVYGQ